MITAGALSAVMCLTDVSAVFAGEQADQTVTGGTQIQQTESSSSESLRNTDTAETSDAGNQDNTTPSGTEDVSSTSGSSEGDTENSEPKTEAGDTGTVTEAVQVSTDVENLVSAAAQISDCSSDQAAQISQQIEAVQNTMESLSEEEQDILSGSREALDNAAAAVEAYQNPVVEQHFLAGDDEHMNSFRYLNGQPVTEALEDVSQEGDAIEAYANGESDTVVQGLKDGTISVSTADGASLRKTGTEDTEDTQAILLGTGDTQEGIDVSQFQGTIDWAAVKNAGVKFAILRCGYGENDSSQDDKKWEYNVTQCERYGIPYGVYLFSYAADAQGAASEANHVLRLIQGHSLTLPVYLDMETNDQRRLGSSKVVSIANTFCSAIRAAGYNAGIYASASWWNSVLSPVAYDTTFYHWVAQWNDRVTASASYQMWQYADNGRVSGITENVVDRDRWYGDFPAPSAGNLPRTSDGTGVTYQTHIQNIGWESFNRCNGETSGTVGQSLRLEAIHIGITGNRNVGITYQTHVQNIGWQNPVSNWGDAGTIGKSLRMEAIKISLTGADASKYDIYYRVHVQNIGWMGWAKNGEAAGTQGYSYRMEALQIVLVDKGAAAPSSQGAAVSEAFREKTTNVSYSTHVQNIGWQGNVTDGDTSGTTGRSLRLEAIKISSPVADIQYRTHVQNIGWQNGWTNEGNVSGTTGRSLRLEAIQIRLTGASASQYDIYYRVHVQNIGWTDWASNGASCGSAGYSYRMEAIQIVLVRKGSSAPGSTSRVFYQR